METRLILRAVLAIIGSGCMGLVVVRVSNPFLKGLGWLAAAFASGAVSIALLLSYGHASPFFTVVVADSLILVAFVLVHTAILELAESRVLISPFGLILICLFFPVQVYFTLVQNSHQIRIVTGGVLIAAQAIQSGLLLLRHPEKGMMMPSWSTASLLLGFAGYNLVRAAFVAIHGAPQDIFSPNLLQFITVIVMLSAALGIGFGFFWMTTAKLRYMLERLASTDPLTGVMNRRIFREACERELARSLRSGELFSLLVADIDHFKLVNDRYGHLAGDSVLCSIANCIQDGLRGSDILGRWGGEEFVVLLPGCRSSEAIDIADRLRRCVETLVLDAPSGEGEAIQVTVSFGVATFRGRQDPLDDVFRRSDAALYQAKEAGRNRVLLLE